MKKKLNQSMKLLEKKVKELESKQKHHEMEIYYIKHPEELIGKCLEVHARKTGMHFCKVLKKGKTVCK